MSLFEPGNWKSYQRDTGLSPQRADHFSRDWADHGFGTCLVLNLFRSKTNYPNNWSQCTFSFW